VKNSALAVYDFIHDNYNAMDWSVRAHAKINSHS